MCVHFSLKHYLLKRNPHLLTGKCSVMNVKMTAKLCVELSGYRKKMWHN